MNRDPGRVRSAGTRTMLAVLRWYRTAVSPLLGPSCRYVPTCSAYAVEAVERFGAIRGGGLALRRLGRCHPLHRGGYDPVPERPADPPTEPGGTGKVRHFGRRAPAHIDIAHHNCAPRRGAVQQVESYS